MANSLLRHEAIVTTLPKTKELRRVAEPLITLGRSRRWPTTVAWLSIALATVRSWSSCSTCWVRVTPPRNGGYLRTPEMRFPQGRTMRQLALVELVDRPDVEAVELADEAEA